MPAGELRSGAAQIRLPALFSSGTFPGTRNLSMRRYRSRGSKGQRWTGSGNPLTIASGLVTRCWMRCCPRSAALELKLGSVMSVTDLRRFFVNPIAGARTIVLLTVTSLIGGGISGFRNPGKDDVLTSKEIVKTTISVTMLCRIGHGLWRCLGSGEGLDSCASDRLFCLAPSPRIGSTRKAHRFNNMLFFGGF